ETAAENINKATIAQTEDSTNDASGDNEVFSDASSEVSDLSDVDALDDIPDAEFFDAVETKQPDAKEFEVHAREVRQAPVTPTSPTTTATSPLDGLPVRECQPLRYNATGDFWYATRVGNGQGVVEVPNSDCQIFTIEPDHPHTYSWCSGPARHEGHFSHNYNVKCTNGKLGRQISFNGLGRTAYSPPPLPYDCSNKYHSHSNSNPWGWCNPNEPSTQLPYPAGVTPDPYIIFNPTSQPATTPPPATPPRATTPPPTEATSPLDGLPVRVCQPLQYNQQYDFWYGVLNSSNIPVEVPNSECMLQTIASPGYLFNSPDPLYCCFGPADSAEYPTGPENVRCTSGKLGRGDILGATCASYPSRVVRNPQGDRPPYENNCANKYIRRRGYRNGNPWGSCNPDEPGTQKPFPENVTPDPDIITQAPTTTSPSTTVRVTTPPPTEARTTVRVTTPPPTEARTTVRVTTPPRTEARTTVRVTTPPPTEARTTVRVTTQAPTEAETTQETTTPATTEAETTQETTTPATTEAETTQEATTPAPTEAETTQETTTTAPTEAETTQETTTTALTEAETTQEATTPAPTEAETTQEATTPAPTEARTTVRVTTPPPTEARTTVRVTTPPPTKARTTPRATTPAQLITELDVEIEDTTSQLSTTTKATTAPTDEVTVQSKVHEFSSLEIAGIVGGTGAGSAIVATTTSIACIKIKQKIKPAPTKKSYTPEPAGNTPVPVPAPAPVPKRAASYETTSASMNRENGPHIYSSIDDSATVRTSFQEDADDGEYFEMKSSQPPYMGLQHTDSHSKRPVYQGTTAYGNLAADQQMHKEYGNIPIPYDRRKVYANTSGSQIAESALHG
ncbi:hypothetical protein L2734_19220, partial [Parashewanella spongiae]|nr:hypothetical protein [Parashewanella spongiae]